MAPSPPPWLESFADYLRGTYSPDAVRKAVAGDRGAEYHRYAGDPLALKDRLWPHVCFYDRQIEMILAAVSTPEVIVVAGNQLGKDFCAAFVGLYVFLVHPEVRVVATSARGDHLRIVFGEIERFVGTAAEPLLESKGGPLIVNHWDIRKNVGGQRCPISYLRGMVSAKGEGMAGHHAAYTYALADEASGIDDETFRQIAGWADGRLYWGNPNDCANDWRRAAEGGDVTLADGRAVRRVLRLTAWDSPNVRREQARRRGDSEETWPAEVPGVLTLGQLEQWLATWDEQRISVGVEARFYEGQAVRLFPPAWLDHGAALAASYQAEHRPRKALAIGIDPGQGEADTSMTAVDRLGVVEERAVKTPDPGRAVDEIRDFVTAHGVPGDRVCMDVGGGGREIAAWLRRQHGLSVRTVGFGESVSPEPQRRRKSRRQRADEKEARYAYVRRRDQLAWETRELLNPAGPGGGFAIPAALGELRRQLAPFPLVRDGEGRLCLPPKNKKPGQIGGQKSLVELIGCSPDRADSLFLAVHAMLHESRRARVWFG